ncbi:MAG TPA: hypothetical protein PL191_02840 [Candidatus Saccharimonas sp.]|nr:hypothetical protein [Candidatus Saccharibacteria bacterium]HPQ82653.1 hypothetical protein [Candidatus Saccharimonas sp.]
MVNFKKLLFQDNTGKYVIAQPPNLPVYTMLVGIIGSHIVATGKLHTFFELLFFGAAFLWSYLEIRFGEAGVRRIMGVLVMIGIFVSRLI